MINISNIERFATHDGPGIRTTIFLKGCPLHCPWCANPETWDVNPVLMHDERKCVRCQMCIQECAQQAITFNPGFHLNFDLCNTCTKCLDVCLTDALSISGNTMKIDEILEIVSKDNAYYLKSNGGITLSGGEPLFQYASALELMKALKQKGYHVALETTSMYSLQHLKEVEPYVDLFLHDIKHLNQDKLMDYTGASSRTVMNNLDYLSETCPDKVIIRVPVIPDFSDDILKDIILYSQHKGFKEVNLLPYHPLGKTKWHDLQKEYIYEDLKIMDKEVLNEYIKFGNENNIKVKTGG